ncbi:MULTISPECIES: universal stress protein [Streptomyces]|uniref:universal stress protein n=1 Tax=Streptomyces TaxID=1883 RepID=UPI00117F801F|nr:MULTISPECIES: universal stress protein [Streptomyces]
MGEGLRQRAQLPNGGLLGLDLVDPSDAVIEFAFDAARYREAVPRVVHGWSVPSSYGDEDALEPWKDKFPDVEVRTQSVVGGAGAHLVDASRAAALIVVGRRIRRAPVGSHIGRSLTRCCTTPRRRWR